MAPSSPSIADTHFGLKISPNVVLRNLLQQYPSGGQFFLEALQNADDTGRAGKFCALLDLRRHQSKAIRPPQAGRAVLQNEAIVFYDDAGFKARDWRSLQFMCDSEKRQSPHEAGAFGMGSRSFFHITDVLQVLSGTCLAALDPDDLLGTGHFGEQVDFVADDLLERYPDECAPFRGVFGCDMRSGFKGSLIRASLRTAERAEKCTFMPHAFDLCRAQRIFREFEETLRNGEVLLFLTCVSRVELWRWDAEAPEPSLVVRARLGVSSGHALPRAMAGPREVKAFLERFESFAELEASLSSGREPPPEILDVVEMETMVLATGTVAKQQWLRCGRFFEDPEVLRKVSSCCCVPLVTLALPLCEQTAGGSLFASLPLPLPTGLPVHVNAHFRLHDNRRAIWRLTQDLDGEHKMWAEWNSWILTSMVPRVYASALELLAGSKSLSSNHGHSAWPVVANVEREYLGVLDALVGRLQDMPLLPTPLGSLARPSEALFFASPTAALLACRQDLLRLCAQAGHVVVDPPPHVVDLFRSRGSLRTQPITWVYWEVLLPMAGELPGEELARFVLALVEWAGSWQEAEVLDLSERLRDIRWVPTEMAAPSTITEAFDPALASSSGSDRFRVVRDRSARLSALISQMSLDDAAVWRVLLRCGLKTELTWEHVADEAALIASDGDIERGSSLLAHLSSRHASLMGCRESALQRLRSCPWLPSLAASGSAEPSAAASQMSLASELFPLADFPVVWAVAPALAAELAIDGLRPGRSVEAEPEVLLQQICALASLPAAPVPAPLLNHLLAAFRALLPLLARLPQPLGEHPLLRDVAFVPCLVPTSGGEAEAGSAVLFPPRLAAFGCEAGGAALSPVVGVVAEEQTVRLIAEAAGVAREPPAEVLAEALRAAPAPAPALAVALATELAARLRAQAPRPSAIAVPTSSGGVEAVERVFVDDAPWRQQSEIVTLHPGVSGEDGRLLGCKSLRERLAQECEDLEAPVLAENAGHDAVGWVRQALQGVDESLPLRLARYADDLRVQSVAFVLWEDAWGIERVPDTRVSELQGPALYFCMDKALSPQDVERMQRLVVVGGEREGLAGDGLAAMYSYCDCPQLAVSGRLHFFDVTQGFVVKRAAARPVRSFVVERVREHFPDTWAPLAAFAEYPTVFRLALRTTRSELGERQDAERVRAELRRAAEVSDKLLPFARHLRRLEFRDGSAPIASHVATPQDPAGLESFFARLPGALSEWRGRPATSHLARVTVASTGRVAETSEWVVSRFAGAATERMLDISAPAILVWLAPVGASAVKLMPIESELRGGYVCMSGLPTCIQSGSRCWLSAAFCRGDTLGSASGNSQLLPLASDQTAEGSAEQVWNRGLLEGPVAESLRGLIGHCTEILLEQRSMVDMTRYFALFPTGGEHLQVMLARATLDLDWLLATVVRPAASRFQERELSSLVLALLQRAGSWKDAELRLLGEKLQELTWLPTESGVTRAVADAFDPLQSPGTFRVVRERRAKIGEVVEALGLEEEAVWRALRACGLKQELTWEDVAAEAALIAADADLQRAAALLEHLNARHAGLRGDRKGAIGRLLELRWVPATCPSGKAEPSETSQLLPPGAAFAPSALRLVWTVAPVLRVEPIAEELHVARRVEAEPEVLLQQVRMLAEAAAPGSAGLPHANAALLGHLQAAFAALLPLLSKLPSLAEHPLLHNVAFIPCLSATDADDGAVLFHPARAAFRSQYDYAALSPVVGVVLPSDPAIRMIAEAAGVRKAPRAEVLAEALCKADAPAADLVVALSVELAARLRAGEPHPERVMVPTALGMVESSSFVYIDDAPWQHQRQIITLHPRISAEDARLLGCSSLRDEMARQCEDLDPIADLDGGAFGQEADLVSQVRQLLLEYGESADLVAEFVQNSDDAGAREIAIFLRDDTFAAERIVDPRAASLQGPAMYICSDNPLSAEDIARMQCVGHSKKRLDFGSSGRFGVGLNVMYRYCDCPQLLANNALHYFDLTRSYVAKANMKRGRQFTVQKLREHFPDSYAPFEIDQVIGRFPTIFRLPLRSTRTDLGLRMDQDMVRKELRGASEIADKLLLFSRNLRRLEFHDGAMLNVIHEATVAEPDKYHGFFSGFPTSLLELKPGPFKHYLARKTITSERPESTTRGEWAIAHRVGVSDDAMLKVLQEQFDQPHGVALLPHGAAAVRVSPVEKEPRAGRICCGPPTPFKTGSCAWLQGSFALLSSRKALPLPEDGEEQPSLDKRWNKMLLDGPVAWSMRGLVTHCTSLVTEGTFPIEQFFSLFPTRGERLQTILAHGTWKAAMNQAIFPVVRGSKVSWVQGPTPTFFSEELPEELQDDLVNDGMDLVCLPQSVLQEYEDALGRPRECLKSEELCDFLRSTFERLHPGAKSAHEPESTSKPEGADSEKSESGFELEPKETKMACLSERVKILHLLRFAVRGLWRDFCKGRPADFYKFVPDQLKGVPLLLTHAMEVSTFCARTKYSSWRDVLPEKKCLFLSRDTYAAIAESVDTSIQGIERVVDIEIPGVRPFTLNDIITYRIEVENSVNAFVGFMDPANESLRVFWSLVAETFAEDHQIIGYDVFTAAQNKAWEKRERREAEQRGEKMPELDEPVTAPIGDRSWCKLIYDWHVLPICSKTGGGENGEDVVALNAAGMCVAPTLIDQDPKVVKSLTAILQEVGIDTVQHDVLSDNRISRLLRTIVVTTNDDMLSLLIEHSNIDNLSGVQRHDLLAYFSVLSLKGDKSEVRLKNVGLLPLFKTAAMDSKFIRLEEGTQYCCVDPSDPHANALSKLMPPKMVMLAWPTAQIKPIYEILEVKLCSGEEAMVNLIIPRLPEICVEDDDGKRSGPFLMELHAYACIDQAPTVMRAAAQTAFVSSEDALRVGTPLEFTSPAGRCAAVFRDCLGSFLPVWWMQQNQKYMEMLHALGMLPVLSPAMILMCAMELDTMAEAQTSSPTNPSSAMSIPELSEALRRKSYELVEEFARAAEEIWPKRTAEPLPVEPMPGGPARLLALPAPSTEDNVKAMQSLLEASTMRMLAARRHRTEATKRQDATARSSRKQVLAEAGARHAEPELVPFRGVAFGSARQVLWTQCPLADHKAPPGVKATPHLRILLDRHSTGVFQVFGSYVQREHAPVNLVMRHLGSLCTLTRSETNMACVPLGSQLHEDLRACWQHLSEHLTTPLSDEFAACTDALDSLDRLKAMPCVAVTSEDVADKPADVLMLTVPRYAFFQLPLLKGKEATLKLYLRHVHAETTKEALVFRALGAADVPRAADYASASERVAAKAKELGRTNWEWVAAVMEACMRGVYEDLLQQAKTGTDLSLKPVEGLRLCTSDGGIEPAGSLVWADEPRWQKRLEVAAAMRFCSLKDSGEQRDVAMVLSQGACLGQLTSMVEERRVADLGDVVDDGQSAFMEKIEQTVRSFEFARGLHAVLQHASEMSERGQKHSLATITQEMRKVSFTSTKSRLRSGLFWKGAIAKARALSAIGSRNGDGKEDKADHLSIANGKATSEVDAKDAKDAKDADVASKEVAPTSSMLIRGSEQDQSVYFDQAEKVVYVGDVACGPSDDSFTAELSFALRHAMPLLFDMDSFLLEALLRCAVKDGPEGIQAFLEKRDIKVDALAPRHLGPGDELPRDLQEHLVWSMHATFGEGESAAVLHNDAFIIAEVSRWPDQKQPGDGLNRSYLMRISADSFEPRKHFEVYKIHSRASASSSSTELAIIPDEGVTDKDPTVDEVGDVQSQADLKRLSEVKKYLREMASMTQDDYKAVMRRLFKTWHPDKVGDTPLANRIFNMLRMHEQWYKRRIAGEMVGDDSWLDKEDLGESDTPFGKASKGLLALTGRTYTPAEGGQSSWFDEFEVEMRQMKVDREAGLKRKAHPRMPEAGEIEEPQYTPPTGRAPAGWGGPTRQAAQDGPTRMVDRQLSARFMQEAKVELVCARRLLKEMDDLRIVPPRAVFHCQQAVEMAINSAMLRTCGVSEDEVAGGAAHDLIDFVKRIKTAEGNTEEQRRAQLVPISEEDVDWLKRAYLASRYPKPGRFGVPSTLYEEHDAQRALRMAERFVEWAERVEDLPDPGRNRRRWNQFDESQTITQPDPAAMVQPLVPQIPRFVPPPFGRASPASPSVGPDPAAKVARTEAPEARKRSAESFVPLGVGVEGGASDGGAKRLRTEAPPVAAPSPPPADAAPAGSGKRWSRRLRKDGA